MEVMVQGGNCTGIMVQGVNGTGVVQGSTVKKRGGGVKGKIIKSKKDENKGLHHEFCPTAENKLYIFFHLTRTVTMNLSLALPVRYRKALSALRRSSLIDSFGGTRRERQGRGVGGG